MKNSKSQAKQIVTLVLVCMHKHFRTILYKSNNIRVEQCDSKGLIYLFWRNEEIELSVCAFLALRSKLKSVDIIAMLDVEHPGVELINLACIDRIWLLDIFDVLHLQEANNHALAMLEINSYIHTALERNF